METRRGWADIRRRHRGLGPIDATAAGWTHAGVVAYSDGSDPERCIFFFINPTQSEQSLVNTCAHEATHAAEQIATWNGGDLTGEARAYLIGWLTQWLFVNTEATL